MSKNKGLKKTLPEENLDLVENFWEIVRTARIKMGLTQEDLAKQLNEKSTIIKKIESGEFKPPLTLARKLEKFLKVRLLEPIEDIEHIPSKYSMKKGEFKPSLGDFLKKDLKQDR